MNNGHDCNSLRKSIGSYIYKYPSSNKEQNDEWLRKLISLKPFINSDPKKREEYYKLRETIALSNGGFAMKYAMRYSVLLNDDAAISELFQEANIGLLETIDAFDLSKETSFTTYAFFHIRKRIIDFIKYNKLVRATRDIARNIKNVNSVLSSIQVRDGIIPTAKEVKKELIEKFDINLKESIIDKILILIELNSASTEDAFISEYKDQISVEDEKDIFKDMEMDISKLIKVYDTKLQEAIKLRFGIGTNSPHSPAEVKLMLGLNRKDLCALK